MRECARAYVRACVRDVFAIYDDNILYRLIMIIIKIMIIQIRHTDDFPSAGIPASLFKGPSSIFSPPEYATGFRPSHA